MEQVSFRRADPDDAPHMLKVKHDAIRELTWHAYTPEQIDAWAPDADGIKDFANAIAQDTFYVVVAEQDGDLLGYGTLNREAGSIDAVFTDPDSTRRGIGAALMRQLESTARMEGHDHLTLSASKNAVGFYEGHGYEQVEEVSRNLGGEAAPFVKMRKDL